MVRVKIFGIAAVMAAGLGLTTSAHAAPLSFDPSQEVRGEAVIEFVAGGCGPGFHPNPWGRCRPNDRGYGYGGYGGPRRFYEGRAYGFGDGRRGGYDYDRPRRFYDGY
ncbi:GCG_CRPN prefix-to-repeats domain-containing protein [Methylobacterium sp. M6A4_1b]